MNFARVRAEWIGNIRGYVLSGLVVALALIPEAIAFSIIAGVDPKVGLYASFSIAVIIAFVGGRPRMIFSSGYFGDIKLWPKDGSREPVVLQHGNLVQALAVLTDGRLASGGLGGAIKLWLLEEEKLRRPLCLRASRNGSKDEWARYIGPDTPWQPSCRDRPSHWCTPSPLPSALVVPRFQEAERDAGRWSGPCSKKR